jgi:predicted nucleic acid-binding protein
MIVVADTSPLNYLILIDHIDVLEPMYGRIAIPPAVHNEMLRPETPAAVQSWAMNLPPWVEVHIPNPTAYLLSKNLDLGEREAISLALTLKAPILIIDERRGRKEAQSHGLRVIGTLGILRDAHELNLLDIRAAIQQLQTTNFRIPAEILAKLLDTE